MSMKVSSSLWKGKIHSLNKSNVQMSQVVDSSGFKNCEERMLSRTSMLSGSRLPSLFIRNPSSKLTDFQHRILLKNVGNLWPPDSNVCNVSKKELKHISARIKWFKRWMKGIHYSAAKHSTVDVQNALEWCWSNNTYSSKSKIKKVRQKTGLSSRLVEAWVEWKQSEMTLSLHRNMLNHIFVENKYPEPETVKALSVHTCLLESDIQSWFLVARALTNATDFSKDDKDEVILWRMFQRCKRSGHVSDHDIDLISDLLDIDSVVAYNVLKDWCGKHKVTCNAAEQNYLVIEEWFEIFDNCEADQKIPLTSPVSHCVDNKTHGNCSKAQHYSAQENRSMNIFGRPTNNRIYVDPSLERSKTTTPEPSSHVTIPQHTTNHFISSTSPSSTTKSVGTLLASEPILKEDDPALVMFSEHFHRYVRRKLKKIRRKQSKFGVPKRAHAQRLKLLSTRKKAKKVGSRFPSFHKQDDVRFVACLKSGSKQNFIKPKNDCDVAIPTTACQPLETFKVTTVGNSFSDDESVENVEVVDALYDLINQSDVDDEMECSGLDEVLTVKTDSESQDADEDNPKLLPISSVTEDESDVISSSNKDTSEVLFVCEQLEKENTSNSDDLVKQESSPVTSLFYLFQPLSK